MKNYKRLSFDEREEISRMLAQHCSLHEIAQSLGRHVSTISRKVRTGNYNKYTYLALKAQGRAERNFRKRRRGKHTLTHNRELTRYIHAKLRLKWSSAQIATELEKDYPLDINMHIAPETIYTYR